MVTTEQLEAIEDAVRPLVVALHEVVGGEEENSAEQPEIWRESHNLYRQIKGYLGNVQMYKILEKK